MGTITPSKRQLAWVFDLNKCIGCQTCSVACKMLWTEGDGTDHQWWMTVNTQPGQGTPKGWEAMGGGYKNGKQTPGKLPTPEEFGGGWDYNYEEVLHGGKGRGVHLEKTKGSKTWGMNWDEDEGAGEFPNSYYFYLPRLCNHCTQPGCLGGVSERCAVQARGGRPRPAQRGPLQGRADVRTGLPVQEDLLQPGGESQPAVHRLLPAHRAGRGPACVRQCPRRAAWIGFLDDAHGSVSKLVNKWKVALPLHPEFETKPNVFYVPPLSPVPLNADGS